MKKLLVTLGLAVATTLAYGQGQISAYSLTGAMTTNTSISTYAGGSGTGGTGGALSSAANGFYFTVLIDSSNPGNNNATDVGWSQVSISNTVSQTLSPLIGNNYTGLAGDIEANNAQTILAWPWAAGQSDYFIVVAWSSSLGTTWSTVSTELADGFQGDTGFFGVSNLGQVSPTSAPSAAQALFGSTGGEVGAFALDALPVPEPATLALAGLGGLSMLFLRRRKS